MNIAIKANSLDYSDHIEDDDFHAAAQVHVVTSRNDLTLRCTRSLFDWWSSYDGKLPLKSEFQILEHLRYAPNIYLAQRLEEGVYKFHVCGEDVNLITGRDTHNRTIYYADHHLHHEDNFNELIKYYDRLLLSKQSFYCTGNVHILGKHTHGYESIDCPLLDQDGQTSYILGAIQLT